MSCDATLPSDVTQTKQDNKRCPYVNHNIRRYLSCRAETLNRKCYLKCGDITKTLKVTERTCCHETQNTDCDVIQNCNITHTHTHTHTHTYIYIYIYIYIYCSGQTRKPLTRSVHWATYMMHIVQ